MAATSVRLQPANSADSWDQPSTSSPGAPSRRTAPAPAVPDDWDNSSSEEDEADNQKIWQDANTKAPMPELVISPSSTAPQIVSPPSAALHTPMRILKRPSPSPSSASASSSNNSAGESLAEREARYHAARQRIFGEGTKGDSEMQTPGVSVVRNPKGPATTTDGDVATTGQPRGFGGRKMKKGPTDPHAAAA